MRRLKARRGRRRRKEAGEEVMVPHTTLMRTHGLDLPCNMRTLRRPQW
jgi:hypothetical protein